MIDKETRMRPLGLLIPIVLAGCQAYPTTEAEFGDSVRNMVRNQQIYTGPVDTTPVEGGDGEMLNTVFETYRSDVSQPEDVDQPIVINVGNQ
jgi:hypothetical protein